MHALIVALDFNVLFCGNRPIKCLTHLPNSSALLQSKICNNVFHAQNNWVLIMFALCSILYLVSNAGFLSRSFHSAFKPLQALTRFRCLLSHTSNPLLAPLLSLRHITSSAGSFQLLHGCVFTTTTMSRSSLRNKHTSDVCTEIRFVR